MVALTETLRNRHLTVPTAAVLQVRHAPRADSFHTNLILETHNVSDSAIFFENVSTPADEAFSAGNFCAVRVGSLSKVQGLLLLDKLLQDEAFHALFERSPKAALTELGIPMQQILSLREECGLPRVLASKQQLQIARQRLAADIDASTLIFNIPAAKFAGH